MKSCVSVFIALFAVNCFLPEGSSQLLSRRISKSTKVSEILCSDCLYALFKLSFVH